MSTTAVLVVVGWVVCGVLAYGLCKGDWRHFYAEKENKYVGHSAGIELLCWVAGVLSLMGLISGILLRIIMKSGLDLCYKMPEELSQHVKDELRAKERGLVQP